jgi:hypothetical protein
MRCASHAWSIGAVAILVAACAPRTERLSPASVDAGATFVAHRVHGGYAIDRLDDGGTGAIRSVARLGSAGPTFEVRRDDGVHAALWLGASATVTARRGTSPAGPVAFSVEPAWDAQAIRLTVRGGDGRSYRTDLFARADARAGIPVLRRGVDTTLDARGTFRAAIRAPDGATVGWIEARVTGPDAPRVFQGVLPEDGAVMGPALAVALDSEIDWIEDHALDVYRGTGSGRAPGSTPGR